MHPSILVRFKKCFQTNYPSILIFVKVRENTQGT